MFFISTILLSFSSLRCGSVLKFILYFVIMWFFISLHLWKKLCNHISSIDTIWIYRKDILERLIIFLRQVPHILAFSGAKIFFSRRFLEMVLNSSLDLECWLVSKGLKQRCSKLRLSIIAWKWNWIGYE